LTLSDRGARVVLTAAWALAIVLVHPAGNFPINDDWSYADTVRRLVEHGEWQLNAWTSMPLGTQVLWGWLFSQPAGFSFTALRISTLVLAWAATLGSYTLLRLAGALPAVALCGAATVAVCPVVFPLAFTFMTDVPALSLGTWALVFVLRHVRERRQADLIAAILLLVATTLIRQTGLGLAMGATAALFAAARSPRERGATLACVVLPAGALLAYTAWVRRSGAPDVYNMRETQLLQVAAHPRLLFSLVMHSAAASYLYVGLFLFPMIPMLARARSAWALAAGLAGGAASGVYMVKYAARMPLLGNVLHDVGLGPVLVARAELWPQAPGPLWTALTVAAAAAAAITLYAVVARVEHALGGPRRAAVVLFGVACAAYLAPLFAAGFLFDRYLGTPILLVLAFLTAIGAFASPSRTAVAATACLVAGVAAFDVAATRDLFAFNRTRWHIVHDVMQAGTPAEDLNGGFEVTGGLLNRITGVPNARLMISLGDVPGYTRVSSREFPRVIGTGPGMLYLLERGQPPAARR
jgi:hypothetical protein